MKTKLLIALALILLLLGGFFSLRLKDSALVNPNIKTVSGTTPSPSSISTPQFNFDASTDLKKELDLVNPKIESSKFDQLKQLIKSF
jgi:hypothetical protein